MIDPIDGLPESPLDAALYYASLDIPVFPCEPETKKPLPAKDRDANGKPIEGTGGHLKATTREETIRRWWVRWPNAWIGYPTGPRSGIDVLDLDKKHNKNGFEHVPEWRELSPVIVSTPNNGAHLLHTSDGTIRNTTDKIALGVDSRGDGGYALLPGAGGYRFIKGGIEDLTPDKRKSLPVWPEKYRSRANGADKNSTHISNAVVEAPIEQIRAALAVIPNDDGVSWEDWNNVGMCVWRASGGDQEGLDAFCEWSAKNEAKHDEATTQARWEHYTSSSPPGRVTAGSLFWRADQAYGDPSWRDTKGAGFRPEAAEEFRERRRFELVPFNTIRLDPTNRSLVKGLMPKTGLVLVWGPPKCGKSFWVFDVMLHVALGRPYRGRKVTQGPVVYCAMEGKAGYPARVEAAKKHYNIPASSWVPLHLIMASLKLVTDHKALIEDIQDQLHGAAPVAIVLDTLNRSITGSESRDEDMSAYIAAADRLWDVFGCAVIIVHHNGVDMTRPRGHTSLAGAIETQIAVARVGPRTAKKFDATVELMKDGKEGDVVQCVLTSVEVGADEDGDIITSCIVEARAGDEFEQLELTPAEDKMWEAFQAVAIGKRGTDDWRLATVTTAEWEKMYIEMYMQNDEKEDVPSDVPYTTSCRQHARLRTSCAAKGHVKKTQKGQWVAV